MACLEQALINHQARSCDRMRIRNSTAVFFALVCMAAVAKAETNFAVNEQPENVSGAKALDRSCYVRAEDGAVHFYLEGPLRDGELPYLQGQPVIGTDGELVFRDEVPQSAIPPRILRAPACPPGKHHLS
jgi:hypothetical protein